MEMASASFGCEVRAGELPQGFAHELRRVRVVVKRKGEIVVRGCS